MQSSLIPPQIGEKAPLFSLFNQDNILTNLADSLGKYVVIYFYPKALTSGCTQQACGLRDCWTDLQDSRITVIGISPDAPNILKKFKESNSLPFNLLSDTDHNVALMYDAWKEKRMYGRAYMGTARVTYVLDPSGTIISVLHKVNISTHADEVLKLISIHYSQIS